MRTVAILNLGVNIWTQKSELPQGNFQCYLTKTKITKQRPSELTDIVYDRIKDEIERMEHVDYNTAIRINVMNVDYIEDLTNLERYLNVF